MLTLPVIVIHLEQKGDATVSQKRAVMVSTLQQDSMQLYKRSWYNDKSTENNRHKLAQAIKTFTSSFTILRIGDRNPNNIMVTEDRQILHRNFRRLFDHDKKKFRINRHCQTTLSTPFPQKSKQVEIFQETCGKAYMPASLLTLLTTGKY